MEDPFFVVHEEVQKALRNVNDLHQRWRELIDDSESAGKEETSYTLSEIKNNIRSIEWDLEDLTETVNIVEANPAKFDLAPKDIEERKQFIKDIRNKIKTIEEDLKHVQAQPQPKDKGRSSLLSGKNKYQRLENEIIDSNDRFIQDQNQQQQTLVREQDQTLEQVGLSVGVLKSMGHQIGDELDDQTIILDELGHEIEQTNSKLHTVLLRVEKMLRLADDKKQTYVLIGLIVMLVVIIILFAAT